jgi:hypothetical protein
VVYQVNGPDCVKTQNLVSFDAAAFWISTCPTFSSTREAINSVIFGVFLGTQ